VAHGSLIILDAKIMQKNRHMHHRTNLWGYVFATKAYIDNQENCSAISPPHVLTTWWTLAH